MANRYMTQFPLTFEKQVKTVFAKVAFNTTGAPVLDVPGSKGVLSFERNGAGDYTITFGSAQAAVGGRDQVDTYVRFLEANCVFDTEALSGSIPSAPIFYVKEDNIDVGNLRLGFSLPPSDADPVSGEVGCFQFIFADSSSS